MGLHERAQILASAVLSREAAVYFAEHVAAGALVGGVFPRLSGQPGDGHVGRCEHGRICFAVGNARADGLDGAREAGEDGDGFVEWEYVGEERRAGGLVGGVRHVGGRGVVEVQGPLFGWSDSAAGRRAVSEEEGV